MHQGCDNTDTLVVLTNWHWVQQALLISVEAVLSWNFGDAHATTETASV